jgi:uncharacterized protein with FMN-binding domain
MSDTKNRLFGGKHNMVKIIIISIIVITLIGGILFATNYVVQLREYKKMISDIKISDVDLAKIPDGSYEGSYDSIMIAATVKVDVTNHIIQDIKLLYHKNEKGKSAERIVDEIKSSQSLKVDTITGATNSSKVILMAVQNALNSGIQK